MEREVGTWHHSCDYPLALGCRLHGWTQSLPIQTGEAMCQEVSERLPSFLCCLVPEPHSFIVMKIRGGEQRRLRCVDVITRPKNS